MVPFGLTVVALTITPRRSSSERPSEASFRRIDLDAHGRLLLAADRDLGDAGDLADVLVQDILGVIVDLGQRHRVGGQGEDQDRRIRRIDLAVGRRRRQVLRQLAARRIDRRLDVLRRAIDIARQIELDRDRAVAERAARGHLRDARDLPELPLQRLGDRGGHDLGAGAGQLRSRPGSSGKSTCGSGATGSSG